MAEQLNFIRVRGAREHNLKDVSVDIPRGELVVLTGLSGSGKSSLAFDTIYAEGQRRYVESLSPYARQFVGQVPKPLFDKIEGLSPAVAIEQRSTGSTPRSTVGTLTEMYDHFRVLAARLGQMHCPDCGTPVGTQSVDQTVEKVLSHPAGTKLLILAPVELKVGQTPEALFAALLAAGADPGAPDGAGNTPLHYAAGYNALAALPALVREGDREKGLALFPVLRALLERERGGKEKEEKNPLYFSPPYPKKTSNKC